MNIARNCSVTPVTYRNCVKPVIVERRHMIINLLKQFDNSGRPPRTSQIQILKWIEANWNKHQVLAINAGTGTGKMAIARAIQIVTNGAYIVATNNLLEQARETYPELNIVKGQDYYECKRTPSMTCAEMRALEGDNHRTCSGGCPWAIPRDRAIRGEASCYNPLSYWALSRNVDFSPSKCIVIDEAHKYIEVLGLIAGDAFAVEEYGRPTELSDSAVLDFMNTAAQNIKKLLESSPKTSKSGKIPPKVILLNKRLFRILKVIEALKKDVNTYTYFFEMRKYKHTEREYLVIKPIRDPRGLIDDQLGSAKVILLSATLLRKDVKSIAGDRSYAFLDAGSPIPVENRLVHYTPMQVKTNYQTPVKDIAHWIKVQLAKYPNKNTIIHVTYSMSLKLKEFFPGVLVNSTTDKDLILRKFKEKGGVWLASGCEEGIDLPGKFCELNIVPILRKPNLGDMYVQKRLALPDGREWYDLLVMKTVIQQVGRSTRGETDSSTSVIGDRLFPYYVIKCKEQLPKSFKESIVWSNKPKPKK